MHHIVGVRNKYITKPVVTGGVPFVYVPMIVIFTGPPL